MSYSLVLKPACGGCGSGKNLYGSNCKHMTLCLSCGKTMAENKRKCYECGTIVTRLIREYNVRARVNNEKDYFVGRFMAGLPNFPEKKSQNKWSLQRDELQGRQLTDFLREKLKNKPWLLEDETGQNRYEGRLEGSQSATYYLLMPGGKEFVATPVSSWYNFNKVAQYKQLTLEEAEEKMKNRRKTADGYQRWMMKAANNGPAAFSEVEIVDNKRNGEGGGRGYQRSTGDDDESNLSDKEEEDKEEEAARTSRLGLNKKDFANDEEGSRGGDQEMDDDEIEKGDDWEHDETFTDDDETIGNDPEEHNDLAPEPAPPEINQDDEGNEEAGELSQSGKELKKLLGKANNDLEEGNEDDMEDMKIDVSLTLVQPSYKKEEAKGKRTLNGEDGKGCNSTPMKKMKNENEQKPLFEKELQSASKSSTPVIADTAKSSSTSSLPVSEEEIRAFFLGKKPMRIKDVISTFRPRLATVADKAAFTEILRRISKVHTIRGSKVVVLLENLS